MGTLSGTAELLADGATDYLYGPGNLPVEQTSSSVTSFYVADQLGSTVVLTNTSGAIAGTYTYNTYGKATAHGGAVSTPLQYGGGYTDPETGLIYLQHRYYDPPPDYHDHRPRPRRHRPALCLRRKQPVNQIDPTGLCLSINPFCDIGEAWHVTLGEHWHGAVKVIHAGAGVVAAGAGACAFIAGLSGVGNAGVSETCGAIALGAAGVQAASGAALYGTGQESGGVFGLDLASAGFAGLGYGLTRLEGALASIASSLDNSARASGLLRALAYSFASGVVSAEAGIAHGMNFGVSLPSVLYGLYATVGEIFHDCLGG